MEANIKTLISVYYNKITQYKEIMENSDDIKKKIYAKASISTLESTIEDLKLALRFSV